MTSKNGTVKEGKWVNGKNVEWFAPNAQVNAQANLQNPGVAGIGTGGSAVV